MELEQRETENQTSHNQSNLDHPGDPNNKTDIAESNRETQNDTHLLTINNNQDNNMENKDAEESDKNESENEKELNLETQLDTHVETQMDKNMKELEELEDNSEVQDESENNKNTVQLNNAADDDEIKLKERNVNLAHNADGNQNDDSDGASTISYASVVAKEDFNEELHQEMENYRVSKIKGNNVKNEETYDEVFDITDAVANRKRNNTEVSKHHPNPHHSPKKAEKATKLENITEEANEKHDKSAGNKETKTEVKADPDDQTKNKVLESMLIIDKSSSKPAVKFDTSASNQIRTLTAESKNDEDDFSLTDLLKLVIIHINNYHIGKIIVIE